MKPVGALSGIVGVVVEITNFVTRVVKPYFKYAFEYNENHQFKSMSVGFKYGRSTIHEYASQNCRPYKLSEEEINAVLFESGVYRSYSLRGVMQDRLNGIKDPELLTTTCDDRYRAALTSISKLAMDQSANVPAPPKPTKVLELNYTYGEVVAGHPRITVAYKLYDANGKEIKNEGHTE